MPELVVQSAPRPCVVRVGRGYSKPDLSMDRVGGDRFVIADKRVEKIARPWIADRGSLFLEGGERAKTLANALKIVKTLLKLRHERRQPIVAVGGGSLCDLVGFAASIYKLGVPLHLVPTTLLAQVDASIGGKNGVDLPEGKNLVGTIRQPDTVLVDPLLLASLPQKEFTSGLAEVVKCGMIRDAALFELLERKGGEIRAREPGVLSEMLVRAITVKVDLVRADEHDRGERALLNYGHTIGHAVEALTDYGTYRHGEAVARGMVFAARLGERLGVSEAGLAERTVGLLDRLGLPTGGLRLDPAEIWDVLGRDKKARGSGVRFVLCRKPGEALVVEQKTVKNHINNIYGKLRLNSRYEAITHVLGQRRSDGDGQRA